MAWTHNIKLRTMLKCIYWFDFLLLCFIFVYIPLRSLGSLVHGFHHYINHYWNVIMGVIASQITSLTIVYSTVYPDADQRKHQNTVSLAFVWGIHRVTDFLSAGDATLNELPIWHVSSWNDKMFILAICTSLAEIVRSVGSSGCWRHWYIHECFQAKIVRHMPPRMARKAPRVKPS